MTMRLSALISNVIVVVSFASESQSAAADAPSWPSGTCVSRDLHYTTGTVICIAPHFGQICNKEGVWDPPTNAAPLQDVCATAQIPTNPTPSTPPPAASCTYLGTQSSAGSAFCMRQRWPLDYRARRTISHRMRKRSNCCPNWASRAGRKMITQGTAHFAR
jgi:hypothetical protein